VDWNGAGPGRWLFNAIFPLVPGPDSYVPGATYVDFDGDRGAIQSAATTIPEVTFTAAREETLTSILTFPRMVIPEDDRVLVSIFFTL
jgi:hypothetical protein